MKTQIINFWIVRKIKNGFQYVVLIIFLIFFKSVLSEVIIVVLKTADNKIGRLRGQCREHKLGYNMSKIGQEFDEKKGCDYCNKICAREFCCTQNYILVIYLW